MGTHLAAPPRVERRATVRKLSAGNALSCWPRAKKPAAPMRLFPRPPLLVAKERLVSVALLASGEKRRGAVAARRSGAVLDMNAAMLVVAEVRRRMMGAMQ